jgi:hypothetical protein
VHHREPDAARRSGGEHRRGVRRHERERLFAEHVDAALQRLRDDGTMCLLRRADVEQVDLHRIEQLVGGRERGAVAESVEPGGEAAPPGHGIRHRHEVEEVAMGQVARDVVVEGDVAAPDQPDAERWAHAPATAPTIVARSR